MINLSDFKINKEEPVAIKIGEQEFHVKPRISTDQYWLMIDEIVKYACKPMNVDPIKVNIASNFYIVQYYTDIVFSPEEIADINSTVDKLVETGILPTVIDTLKKLSAIDTFFNDVMAKYEIEKQKMMSPLSALSGLITTFEPIVTPFLEQISKGELKTEADVASALNSVLDNLNSAIATAE